MIESNALQQDINIESAIKEAKVQILNDFIKIISDPLEIEHAIIGRQPFEYGHGISKYEECFNQHGELYPSVKIEDVFTSGNHNRVAYRELEPHRPSLRERVIFDAVGSIAGVRYNQRNSEDYIAITELMASDDRELAAQAREYLICTNEFHTEILKGLGADLKMGVGNEYDPKSLQPSKPLMDGLEKMLHQHLVDYVKDEMSRSFFKLFNQCRGNIHEIFEDYKAILLELREKVSEYSAWASKDIDAFAETVDQIESTGFAALMEIKENINNFPRPLSRLDLTKSLTESLLRCQAKGDNFLKAFKESIAGLSLRISPQDDTLIDDFKQLLESLDDVEGQGFMAVKDVKDLINEFSQFAPSEIFIMK